MGIWEALTGLLPNSLIHIERDETNITLVNSGEGHQLTTLKEDEDGTQLLRVDLNSLTSEEKSTLIGATWEEQGEIFVDESQKDKKAIERASQISEVRNSLTFFESKLTDRQFGMLKAALYLRNAWEGDERYLSRREMRKRKEDIAQRYGQDAWAVCNLSTAGYFDEGGYIREVFQGLDSEDEREYQSLFQEIVENQPFTVFVGWHDTVPGIIGKVKQRVRQKQQYRVEYDFVDVRGIGNENRDKIQQAVEELSDLADEFEHETISKNPDMVERVYLSKVSGLIEQEGSDEE